MKGRSAAAGPVSATLALAGGGVAGCFGAKRLGGTRTPFAGLAGAAQDDEAHVGGSCANSSGAVSGTNAAAGPVSATLALAGGGVAGCFGTKRLGGTRIPFAGAGAAQDDEALVGSCANNTSADSAGTLNG